MAAVELADPGGTSRWHARDAEDVLDAFHSTRAGLSAAEARQRLTRYGANVIEAGRSRGPLRILLTQFTDVIVLVLVGAAVLAAALGEPQDIAAIVAIVILNAVLGFVQEYRAERAVAALNVLAAPTARVCRDGVDVTLPARELVPGDIVLLGAGAVVPADLRLVEVVDLRTDEAILTGESQPVEKSLPPIRQPDLPLGDRRNMAYKSTAVTSGRGMGVVVNTGMRTELGRIATMLAGESSPRTPLQDRLARFSRNIALVVIALCVVIFVAGLLRGEAAGLMFMTALSLAVAAIPEALPAVVTVSLAIGARKMARRQALIRRLSAVESLGSVTFVCSDKTGTLTENQMRVEAIQLIGAGAAAPVPADAPTGVLLDALALNNDAGRAGSGEPNADPTESALYRAAVEGGRIRDVLEREQPRVSEVPFSSSRARMTTIHRSGRDLVAYTKGAPERVIPACVNRLGAHGIDALDQAAALAQAQTMASSGLRVLAVSMRHLTRGSGDDPESNQTLLGFVGLLDPPRPEAREAVALCQAAGIHIVMITGDHAATAQAIAQRLGIATSTDQVMTGAELTSMSDVELESQVQRLKVYARVEPEAKIRIVQALQRRSEYVAVTGDGVNDAPALRRANVGIAMGRSGTDVAREAAHMVLLDDNFATIVGAVREGRRVYDNIRRFVRYGLSTNSGEIWTLFLAPFLGLPLPLLPIHILWMNLVTDGLPGLALATEPPERDVMRRPPRPPNESIFANGLWQHAVWVGLLMAGLTLGMQAWAIQVGDTHWQSMTFTVLTLSQLAHVLAIRSEHESLVRRGLWSNPLLLGAVVFTVAMQMATLYVPLLRRIFKTAPLSIPELAACFGVASIVYLAAETEKWILRRRPAR